ncbi:MAG: ATP-dependent DNA helicase RecG [Bacteroidales bacterium]|jgi:ATP-dependent DNA helicase RecG
METMFNTKIQYLKGVGAKRAEILNKEASVYTLHDLIMYFPYKYIDKSKFYNINEISNNNNSYIQLKGIISDIQIIGNNRARRLVATLKDATGTIDLVWFNGIKYIENKIQINKKFIIFGKPTLFSHSYNISHPEITSLEEFEETQQIPIPFQPLYNTSEKMKKNGLDSKGISKLCYQLLSTYYHQIEETLPDYFLSKYKFIERKSALFNIHFPQSQQKLSEAQNRLKFEEMFFIQMHILQSKITHSIKSKGFLLPKVGFYFNEFYSHHLPFQLTNAQKRVIKEIRADFISGKQMNRLLQGDVGSGKTIISLLLMLIAIDNEFQCCLMAPTEILANQHYDSISLFLKELNINIALLTGTTKSAKRKEILTNLKENKISILIGTHALIEDTVMFNKLGLVIIDEQHRFGVEQRAKLWMKNEYPPHVLVMTATPIPRTLAMTVYGDLDLSLVDELPQGRKPIITYHYNQNQRDKLITFLKKQISLKRQIYVVFPLIQESESLDLRNLIEGYESFKIDFPPPLYQVGCLHGKMNPDDKEKEMQRFIKGETNILLATTVIEVGVNIPNASVMLIENAERFGLSQLHQLRGRVGRGAEQSYCILLTGDKLTTESKKRIQVMLQTNDGFEIANFDLRLRGPGDMGGTKQSGMLEFKLIDIIKDEKIISFCRDLANSILKNDPLLEKKEHHCIKTYLKHLYQKKNIYYKIS